MAQPLTAEAAQRGQVLVFIALVLALGLLPLAAYAIDAATVTGASARLQAATAEAAMLAAQQIDVEALRSRGEVTIDGVAARAAASELLETDAPGAVVSSVTFDRSQLTLRTSQSITLPFAFLPDRSIVLRAKASATLIEGYDSPSSRFPLPTSTF
jgi:hypothetical protein